MQAGERVGPYRLVERLGQGGMGVVFRATGPDGAVVALKTLRLDRPELRRALAREVALLASLEHPGIARLVDAGQHGDHPWYAMTWVSGQPLVRARRASETLVEDPTVDLVLGEDLEPELLDLGSIATTFHRVCQTLAWLHGEGMVHRDLKPDNFVLRADGWPVLLDFGLAGRFAGGRTRELAAEGIVRAGTRGLVAPEQWAGRLVDARADLYAVGAMLYLALTGGLPPAGPGPLGPRPREVEAEVPPALDDLVARLLAREPTDRPGHAEDVARVLEGLGADPTPWPGAPPARAAVCRPRIAGREAELEAIDDLLRSVARGRSGVLLFTGGPGCGRSRLVLEAASRAWGQGVRPVVVPARAPLASAFAELVGLRERSSARDSVAPTVATVSLDGRSLPDGTFAHSAEGWLAWLSGAAAARPLLLVVDDLDTADEVTVALVSRLRAARPDRVGVVASAREISALPIDLTGDARAVPPLDGEAVRRLVADLLAVPTVDAAGAERLAARTGGRPLLVVEAVRTGVELGLLERVQGRWRMARPLEELVPLDEGVDLLGDLVLRRTARLEPAHREVLAVAALVDERVDPELVRTLLPGAPVDLALARGVRDGTLDEDQGELRFVHAAVRATLASTLSPERRAALHAAVADRLEDGDLRADHLERAGRRDEAREAFVAQGRAARAGGRALAAIAAYGRALRLSTTPAWDLRCELLTELENAGRLQQAHDLATEILAGAPPGSAEAVSAARARGFVLSALDPTRAEAAAEEAVRVARAAGERDGLASALSTLAFVRTRLGRMADAREAMDAALALEPREPIRSRVLVNLGSVLTYERKRLEARATFERALAGRPPPRHRAPALANLSIVHLWGGDLDLASATLELAAQAYREVGDLGGALFVELAEASVDRLAGRLESAMLRASWVAEVARRAAMPDMLADALSRWAEIAVDAGDEPRARACWAELAGSPHVHVKRARSAEARLDRWLGDLAGARRALELAGDPEELVGDPRPLLYVEAAHLALAEGRDAGPEVERVERVLAQFPDPIAPNGVVGVAVGRLRRALDRRAKGLPLHHGEHPDEVPAAIRARAARG